MRKRNPDAGLAVVVSVFYVIQYAGTNFTLSDCFKSWLTNQYLWAVVLVILGCGKKFFDFETFFTHYISASSFGVYIWHYPILISTCYLLHRYLNLPAICNYLIALVLEVSMTFAAYELIRFIPIIGFCVPEIRSKKYRTCPGVISLRFHGIF